MNGLITFAKRCELQARFIEVKAKQTGEDTLTVAERYAMKLAEKIDHKYLTLYPKTLKVKK